MTRDGDSVVLKTAAGKEINAPISRLSKTDQTLVEKLKENAGLDNPFD